MKSAAKERSTRSELAGQRLFAKQRATIAVAKQRIDQSAPDASGAHSKTLPRVTKRQESRQVLECASPLALFVRDEYPMRVSIREVFGESRFHRFGFQPERLIAKKAK